MILNYCQMFMTLMAAQNKEFFSLEVLHFILLHLLTGWVGCLSMEAVLQTVQMFFVYSSSSTAVPHGEAVCQYALNDTAVEVAVELTFQPSASSQVQPLLSLLSQLCGAHLHQKRPHLLFFLMLSEHHFLCLVHVESEVVVLKHEPKRMQHLKIEKLVE